MRGWSRKVHLPLLIFILVLLAKQIWVVGHWVDSLRLGIERLLLCTVGFLLMLGGVACSRPGKRQLAWMVALSGAISFLSLGDLLHHRAFSDLSSASSLRYANQLPGVFSSIPVLLRWSDLWLLADFPILFMLAWLPARRWASLRWPAVAGCVALGAVLVSGVFLTTPRLGPQRERGNAFVAGELGVLGYHLWDGANALAAGVVQVRITQETVQRVAQHFTPPTQEPSTFFGAASGRNLIVIQVESLQAFALGLRVAGGPVTPYLDALAEQSLLRGALFHQTSGGRTSDAHFVFHCSLYPAAQGAAAFQYAKNDLHCLPEILRARGYGTHAFQTLQPDYWNAAAIEAAMGFAHSYSGRDFEIDEVVGFGLSDRSFFRQMAARLHTLEEPFYAFMQTLTSHSPFRFEGVPTFDVGHLRDAFLGGYLQVVHYTDRELGLFVGELAASGLLDRSVLVIYGDHDGVTRNHARIDELVPIAPGDEWTWTAVERGVPLIVRLPGGAHPGEVEVFAGQIDLAPTLLGLLGIAGEGTWFLGRDLLAPTAEEEVVVFPDGSVLARDRVLRSDGGFRCYGAGGERIDGSCTDLEKRAQAELFVSRQLLDGNLLPRLLRRGEGKPAEP